MVMVFRVTVVPMVIVLKVVLMSMMILVLVTRTKVMIPPHSKYYIDIKDDGDEVDDAWWQLLLVAESGDWYLGGRDVLRVCLYICVCVCVCVCYFWAPTCVALCWSTRCTPVFGAIVRSSPLLLANLAQYRVERVFVRMLPSRRWFARAPCGQLLIFPLPGTLRAAMAGTVRTQSFGQLANWPRDRASAYPPFAKLREIRAYSRFALCVFGGIGRWLPVSSICCWFGCCSAFGSDIRLRVLNHTFGRLSHELPICTACCRSRTDLGAETQFFLVLN